MAALDVLCHHPLRRKARSGDSACGPPHRTSCSASPAGKGGAGGAGPNADDLRAFGRGPLSALQCCLGPGVILKVLRCPTANGGGGVEDPLADLTHTEGDLASFERLDVTPGLKLVLRRFCHGLKVLARPDITAELYVISAERVTGGGFHALRSHSSAAGSAARIGVVAMAAERRGCSPMA